MIAVLLAVFAGLLLTVNSGQLIFGRLFTDSLPESVSYDTLRLLLLSSLSFAAFWCACGVHGTVRAVLCTVPAIYAVALAHRLGIVLAVILGETGFMAFLVSKV